MDASESMDVRKFAFSTRRIVFIGLLLIIPIAVFLVLDEFRSSRLQAYFFSHLGSELRYRVAPGASPAIRFPKPGGPYDQRLGYASLPAFTKRLTSNGYVIDNQARQPPQMLQLADLGLFIPYPEKHQAGLSLIDSLGVSLQNVRYPQRVYSDFEALPRSLVNALLYIENRSLLDDGTPLRNPAIEWSRFSKALLDEARHTVAPGYRPHGGSTLATQIEKYRHSPEGRTASAPEKLRQMVSASIRAYLNGADTTATRRHLVVDYLNTVPLAARAGFGEISGLGDGMWAWYGRDFQQVNRLLNGQSTAPLKERALVYKEALSLMISQRRPSYYLGGDMQKLEAMTNSYLRLLAKDGIISTELRDAALGQSLRQQKERVRIAPLPAIERKGTNAVRIKLAKLLGVPRLYDLDRLDLNVRSTLDAKLQQAITAELFKLQEPDYAGAAGLFGERLLEPKDLKGVTYSFTLIERTPTGNRVRVQADNFSQPFDINEGAKLDLGSTAKLRTLVNYLEVITELHAQYQALDKKALAKEKANNSTNLRRWALEYLATTSDRSLAAMLEASLLRKYSASPYETFFTGGGLHTFRNFEKEDNARILTVREAAQRSVNLVFIRLMRDVVSYYKDKVAGGSIANLLGPTNEPRRMAYLQRFADKEGRQFLSGFYRKYQGLGIEASEDKLVKSIRATPKRLAVIHRSIAPQGSLAEFTEFMKRYAPSFATDQALMAKWYQEYSPARFNLHDRGYLAGIHPLELWLLAYRRSYPTAGYTEVIRASVGVRQEVYQWLFKANRRAGQDSRIRQMLEVDGFWLMHKAWKRLGYSFDALVPSYATAIGASADRPAALADLMGVIVNDGVRLPTSNIDRLQFAAGTPYETVLVQAPAKGERILAPEITRLVRQVLSEVVELGTARRVAGAFDLKEDAHVIVGGKTGTGDNRFKTFAKGGGLISERVVSRSGAFVFYLSDRYYGTLVAYVAGPKAADYKFTSALPVQILKVLAPTLKRHLKLSTVPRKPASPPAPAPSAPPPSPLGGVQAAA